jgi:TRAP-type transport system periplasmic protein
MKLCFAAVTALAAAAFVLDQTAQAEPAVLKMRSTLAAEHPSSKAMEIFKAEAARLSGGTIEVELDPLAPGSRGTRELLDEVRARRVFGAWIGVVNLSRLVPEVGALGLPFAFDNFDQVRRVLKGPVGALIEEKAAAKGFVVLCWMQLGPRHVTNSRRPLRTLGDFSGLKIRVQPNETQMAAFRALGANPVAMDVNDLVVALRQHDVDGQENPYSLIYHNRYYEAQTYLSDTAHFLDLVAVVAGRETFMSLEPQQQKAIREAAAIAVVRQWKIAAAEETESLAGLKEKGLQFDPLPPATRTALRQATAVVIKGARRQFGDELVDGILAIRKPLVSRMN